tara:strand:+ start:390 stop:1091 length:702 start_codon:yes stop_codon:yes gene_type:complete
MIDTSILKDATKIAVSLSGGADSAILFYHACDVLPDKTFYPFSGYDTRRPDSIFYAMEVYQFIKDSYPNVNIAPHHTFKYTSPRGGGKMQTSKEWDWKKDPKSVLHHEAEMEYLEKIGYTYTLVGMTSNPPEDAIKKFKMDVDTGHGVIEPRRHKNRKEVLYGSRRHTYRPFVNKDKSYVKMMYEKYNVLDKLFPLTASCIGFPDETDNGKKPCRNCVWCKERLWAFGEEHLQ